MVTARLILPSLLLATAGCSPDPAPRQKITGDAAAVEGWPHQPTVGGFLIENCCTLRLSPDARPRQAQGIDSLVYDVSGPGYVLRIVFGPFDSGEPAAGYRFENKRIIDGVELNALPWVDRARTPPEGRLLWLGQIGGGIIDGVEHTPWSLRVSADCATPVECNASAALVGTLRF
jgi:hypothetical protein